MSQFSQPHQWECGSLEQLRLCAQQILQLIKPGRVIIEGPLGAGKTTLVQYLMQELGVVENAASPTYQLLSLYDNERIAHLDLYRLEDDASIDFLALDDLNSDWFFIEWGARFEKNLQPVRALINIEIHQNNNRIITLMPYD
jgi:tRNA threonylcarbamoyladenosine biosynthesis protein TsaE